MPERLPPEISKLRDAFIQSLDDDLNTPAALAVLDQLVNQGYSWWKELEAPAAKDAPRLRGKIVKAVDTFHELTAMFGLSRIEMPQFSNEDVELVNRREVARKQKNFRLADEIREQLAGRGLMVEDTPQGPIVIPKR
jgi:cysteinyl-tRNA synthetase